MDLNYEIENMISKAGGRENLAAEIILENSEYYSESATKEAMSILGQDTIKRILFNKDIAINNYGKGRVYSWTHRELVYLKENWDVLPLIELSKRLKKPERTINNTAKLFFKNKTPVINFCQKHKNRIKSA